VTVELRSSDGKVVQKTKSDQRRFFQERRSGPPEEIGAETFRKPWAASVLGSKLITAVALIAYILDLGRLPMVVIGAGLAAMPRRARGGPHRRRSELPGVPPGHVPPWHPC